MWYNELIVLITFVEYVQKHLKTSLRKRCRHALSADWLWDDKAKKFPLREYFVGLKQRKKIRRAMKDTYQKLKRIHDILNVEVKDGGGISVALIGL